MPRNTSARRFAQAAFQIALERDELESWAEDLTLLARSLEDTSFCLFLDSPQTPVNQKVKVVVNTLTATVSPLALNLMALLASRSLVYLMPEVVENYEQLLDAQQNIERANVISAVRLDDEEIKKTTAMINKITSKEIRLTSRVDPGIIGGFVIQVGDRVIDGSTRTRIELMRRDLVGRQ